MTFKEFSSKWYIKLIAGLIGFGGLGGIITYTGSLYYEDLQIVKDVNEFKSWKEKVSPKINDTFEHINKEKIQKLPRKYLHLCTRAKNVDAG